VSETEYQLARPYKEGAEKLTWKEQLLIDSDHVIGLTTLLA